MTGCPASFASMSATAGSPGAYFFFQAEDGIRGLYVTGVQTCALPIWAMMLVLAEATDRPTHLLELGLLRARLCELVATRTPGAEKDRAFTVGLFSVVDSLLGARMPQLLEDLPFDERTTLALGEHAGPEGRLLAGVLAYEAGDFDGCVQAGVSLMDIARAYRDALDWTDGALIQLAA